MIKREKGWFNPVKIYEAGLPGQGRVVFHLRQDGGFCFVFLRNVLLNIGLHLLF
jgi:hypothetical protein